MHLKLLQNHKKTHVLLILEVFTLSISCTKNAKKPGMIYILEWTTGEDWQYVFLEMGQESFVKANCSYQNCFLSKERSYFKNILDFDVLLFNIVHINTNIRKHDLPPNRSASQLYVLVALEPAEYFNIGRKYNWFFNMTLSYKLTSGIVYPYVYIKDKKGEIVGPSTNMRWEYEVNDMNPTNNDIIFKLRYKSTAAIVLVSHCNARSGRDEYIINLKRELLKYRQQIDIYGSCKFATLKCAPGKKNGIITSCVPQIESDYYFFLAFENSFDDDYVSEKLLHGLNHFAVPVVYGGANYSR